MKAPRTRIKLQKPWPEPDSQRVLDVVPMHGNAKATAKERARYVYLWVGDDKACYGHVSGARTLRKLAKAILAEVGE